MSNNTSLPKNVKSPSTENADIHETWWEGLFKTRAGVLWLAGVLFLLLINIMVLFGMDTRPNVWLFPFNMSYWSGYFSVILWITAIWVISESIVVTENYRPLIRILAATSALLVMVFVLQYSFNTATPSTGGQMFWFNVVAIAAACCLVRSLFLLYEYRYGEDEIDLEEAQWFWGISGFIFVGIVVLGLLYIIPVTVQVRDNFHTVSLLKVCGEGLQELIRRGTGTLVLRGFAFLLLVSSIAFAYVIGRWLLIIYLKIRGE